MIPRGIRNNNPGNLVTGADWDGLATPAEMTADQAAEKVFCVFRLPVWGIRAMAKLLKNYYQRHGLQTVAQIMARYAPAFENPTQVYVQVVAKTMDVEPTQVFALNFKNMEALVLAIIHFENGCNPYTWEIPAGIILAGIEPIALPGKTAIIYR